MSRNRFEQILYSLQHTDIASEYEDEFHLMRQWEKEWNKNMEYKLSPSWLSVLDKSMMKYLNKYCPVFMCIGRKPQTFGNECHKISCALTLIWFRDLIVEGKDWPKELGQKNYSELGQTVGLMLRMWDTFYSACKEVVMDIGFCVSRVIVKLERKGVYRE